MKILFCLSLLLVALSDGHCQSRSAVTKVEFTTFTRGYQKQLFLTKDSLVQIVDGRQEENKVIKRKLDPSSWEELTKALGDLKLEKFPSLQSPSSKRTFDGARHSTIVITTDDGKEWKHAFDDENPHPSLKSLMEAILRIETGSSQR